MILLRDVLFPFLPLESIQSHSLAYTICTKNLPKFSATSDVRHWVNQVRRCAAWLTDMEEKQTGLKIVNKQHGR